MNHSSKSIMQREWIKWWKVSLLQNESST